MNWWQTCLIILTCCFGAASTLSLVVVVVNRTSDKDYIQGRTDRLRLQLEILNREKEIKAMDQAHQLKMLSS